MEDDGERRKELSAFLQQKRQQLSPTALGINPGTRRRTPGLRREEVAQIAGISVGWYTWLEQGREINVSEQTLDSIARTLQLTPIERLHLFRLASKFTPITTTDENDGPPSGALQRVLDNQGANPAYVMNWRWDTIRWNRAACAVFCDFNQMPQLLDRNIVYLMFTNPTIRTVIVDWKRHAQRVLAQFRADYAEYRCDPAFGELIGMLKGLSSEFNEWWDRREVGAKAETRKTVNHPKVGRLELEQTAYRLEDDRSSRLVLYMPVDEATTQRLQQLHEEGFIERTPVRRRTRTLAAHRET
jgi:transcriptional regulator with XRE-family HTH domain